MVLSEGNLIEYDSPTNLLKKEYGHFRALVESSNDREKLVEIALRVVLK